MQDDVPDATTLVRTWAAMVGPRTTLIAHSNAGYLAPSIRERAGTDARVIFMDAALPPEVGPTPDAKPVPRSPLEPGR